MKRIPLNLGKFAIVDDEDYEWLIQWKWRTSCHRGQWKVYRSARIDEAYHTISMSRQIAHAPKGLIVDHINHDQHDNRRTNLRWCTNAQNVANRRGPIGSNKKFIGIYPTPSGKWTANAKKLGQHFYFGTFADPMVAALSRDFGALKLFGEFACLNYA